MRVLTLMRFGPALLLIVSVVLSLSTGLSQPVPQAPDDRLIVPGQRIGKWSLEMTIRDLARISGPLRSHIPPFSEVRSLDSVRDGSDSTLVEVHWEIGLVAATRAPMEELKQNLPPARAEYLYFAGIYPLGSDQFWTPEGLHSGSSRKQLLAAYGKPTSITRRGRHTHRLVYDEIGLAAVELGESGITYFIVFRPGTGRTYWKFSAPQLVSTALILVLVLATAVGLLLIRRRRARA